MARSKVTVESQFEIHTSIFFSSLRTGIDWRTSIDEPLAQDVTNSVHGLLRREKLPGEDRKTCGMVSQADSVISRSATGARLA